MENWLKTTHARVKTAPRGYFPSELSENWRRFNRLSRFDSQAAVVAQMGHRSWVEDELLQLGAIFEKVVNWQPFALTDGRLVTGQNHASSTVGAQVLFKLVAVEVAA